MRGAVVGQGFMNMTDIYFHCTDDGQVLSATRGVAIDGLVEAFETPTASFAPTS